MRVRAEDDLEEFVTVRSQDLHHDGYLLTADQDRAEQLVAQVLAGLARDRVDLSQATTTARLRMAQAAAHADAPPTGDRTDLPARFRALAALTARQRAILTMEAVVGHTLRSAARALRLPPRDLESAYAAIPAELADQDPADLRRLLEDFGDLAESPDPATTLAAMRAVPPPPPRPWWSYAAAAVVVAVTVSSLWATQTWHDNWLQTAAGLNHSHGTHYPAYTQGYKLVDIHDIAPGPGEALSIDGNGAIMIACAHGESSSSAIGRVSSGLIGDYAAHCSTPQVANLTPVSGETLLAIDDFTRAKWPVATYKKLSWDEYPVADSDFEVEHDLTLHDVAAPVSEDGTRIEPTVSGPVLTIRSQPGKLNGTFGGTLTLPRHAFNTEPEVSGLLSPTTTGRFRIMVDFSSPWSTCGTPGVVIYNRSNDRWCEFYDRTIPQASFQQPGPVGDQKTIPIRITVQHARGSWQLQVVAGRYKIDTD